ncbi:MAG: peptidylprolyl isomerase [Clostridia bacterium]|nr:peptidylprolyl isomerase [Clostridia bacterium]
MTTGEKILIELYPDKAPITAKNFQDLVAKGFYDGIIFHRVIAGFMIQGGCPEGTGTGGPGYSIKGEFSANGVDNPISHERGVISMGRTGNQYSGFDTAGSQFFICHSTSGCKHLDGQYAAFGKVISGMEVVDRIASVATDYYDKPLEEQKMEKVYFVEKIAE